MADVVLNIKGDSSDAVRAISQVGNEFDKVNAENKKHAEEYKKGTKQIVDANKGVITSVSDLNKAIGNNIKSFLAFSVVTGTLKSLVSNVIQTRAEFQKFEAVLTNTLGSKALAEQTLTRIQDFASKTPFSVAELTASFVKLANAGFKPTNAELTKLGDLAASQGKSFDQLTEAVIDAQTGEFERLKEFGIRAKTVGDNVTLSFKGQEVVVNKFNQGALRDAIVGFGDLEGVAGGMAAISDTLGGKISNLGDNFDAFFNNLGESSEGVFAAVLDGFNALLSASNETDARINSLNKTLKGEGVELSFFEKLGNKAQIVGSQFQSFTDQVKKTATETNNFAKGVGQLQKQQTVLNELYRNGKIDIKTYEINAAILRDGIKDLTAGSAEYTKELNKQLDKTVQLTAAQNKAAEEARKKAAEEARKKAAEDEKKLRKLIEDNAVEAIQNDQAREEAKAKLEFERKKKEIEDSKASAKTKNEALLSLDLEYANKKAGIENKYNDEREKREKEAQDKQNKILVDAANKNQEVIDSFIKYELEALDGKYGEAEKVIAKQQIQTKIALGTATPEEVDAYNNDVNKQKEADTKKQIEAYKKFVDVFGGELKDFLNEQFDAQQSLLDAEQDANDEVKQQREDKLSDLQSQLAAEYELQRQGLANNVDAILAAIAAEEQAKQQDLENDKRIKEEKAKLAKAQLLVDSATQASSLFTASAEIYKSLAALGPIGVAGAIATIALMIGSFVSAKAKALEAINSGAGFQTGGHTGNMGETEVAGVVHGQEFVSTAKTTRKHRNLLEAMHSEDYSGLTIKDLMPLLAGTGVTFNKDVLNEIRADQSSYTAKKENEPMMLINVMNSTNKKVDKFFQYVKNKPESGVDSNGNTWKKQGNTIKIIRKK